MTKSYLFTSESVSEGHPDKMADQISDAVLDELLQQDTQARVACETFIKTGFVLIGGEITTKAWVDVESLARRVMTDIGYTDSSIGFDGESCGVLNAIGKQSPDIAQGVDQQDNLGAGDQGIMFGYATDETDSYMPAPIHFAQKLMRRQADLRHRHVLPWLRPDAKAQVTIRYDDQKPAAIDNIVFSTQHHESIHQHDLREAIIEEIIRPTIDEKWLTDDTRYWINPTGRFVVGGPMGDTGLTGRKIIVDTYGGMARHGGGAFSGKDPSKVDRSAAYMARYIAKNIVAAGLAKRCEIQLSYAIGVVEPTAIYIDTFGTSQVDHDHLIQAIRSIFDLTPLGIIKSLDLLQPRYRQIACYGHFGRQDIDLPWERLDQVDALLEQVQ